MHTQNYIDRILATGASWFIGNRLVEKLIENIFISVACKYIVAMMSIKKGELFTEENLTVKRSGIGISPMEWDNVILQKAKKNFDKDKLIEL